MLTPSILLPKGFKPQEKVLLENFLLEALQPKHNQDDYIAWTSSIESVLPILDPKDQWMADVSSVEQNLQDLTKDYQEFLDKKTFRYAILSPDESKYLGCFYIRPTKAAGFSSLVEFWFTDQYKHLEKEFHIIINEWLKDVWNFNAVAMPGREMSWEKYHSLEK